MSSLRRRPRRDRTRGVPALRGVVALPRGVSGDGRSDARRSRVGSATADPVDRYDLPITDHGLVVGAVGGFTTPIPALVPWSEVSSVTVNGVAELAGGSHGEILEIEVSDGGWSGDDRVQRFVVQATGLQAFVEAASSRRTLTEGPDSRDTGRVAGRMARFGSLILVVVAGMRSQVSRWTGPSSRWATLWAGLMSRGEGLTSRWPVLTSRWPGKRAQDDEAAPRTRRKTDRPDRGRHHGPRPPDR